MRSIMLMLVAALAALFVATGPAFAGGGEKGDGELGIYGGYGWLDDYGRFHPKDGPLFGARAGYFFSPQWSAEISAQRLMTKTEFDIVGVEDVDVTLDAVRLNLLYNFAAGQKFRPFLTVGGGYEMTSMDGYGSDCGPGWNAGGGFRWFMTPNWNLRADGRYVMTNVGGSVDESQGNIEATLGLNWVFGGKSEPAAVVVPPPANRAPSVSLVSDRSEILPGENVTLRATASDPDGDPLTYAWSSTSGQVTGNGPTATFNFGNTVPPATSTITVRVADGRGLTASSNASVGLREPARPAEAVSCLAGGFPSNLSRLTNVDKACLDDMAQRLRSDPAAHVVVIGHADSHERSADAIATQRANAVKDYLVQERGVDAARVVTRSVAATRPKDAGSDAITQAGNRRVEVWFVPQGAKDPE
jgi:outer membrane protein OmpA-like peptidoglycan-associated protein